MRDQSPAFEDHFKTLTRDKISVALQQTHRKTLNFFFGNVCSNNAEVW